MIFNKKAQMMRMLIIVILGLIIVVTIATFIIDGFRGGDKDLKGIIPCENVGGWPGRCVSDNSCARGEFKSPKPCYANGDADLENELTCCIPDEDPLKEVLLKYQFETDEKFITLISGDDEQNIIELSTNINVQFKIIAPHDVYSYNQYKIVFSKDPNDDTKCISQEEILGSNENTISDAQEHVTEPPVALTKGSCVISLELYNISISNYPLNRDKIFNVKFT